MKKCTFFSFCGLMIISTLLFSVNSYADAYTQDLKKQMINHLESEGYHFTNIGDGWHTIKVMETICAEVTKPVNSDSFTISPIIRGAFRQQFAWRMISYVDLKQKEKSAYYGFYVSDGSPTIGSVVVGTQDTEAKMCVQNVSLKEDMDIQFPFGR